MKEKNKILTKQPMKVMKKNGRIKVIEVFPDEGEVARLLYLILKELNERLNSRRSRELKFLHNKRAL